VFLHLPILKIEKIISKKFKKNYQLDKPKGVRGRNSNNDLIRKLLKWEPKYNLYDGLKKTYQWIEEDIKKKSQYSLCFKFMWSCFARK